MKLIPKTRSVKAGSKDQRELTRKPDPMLAISIAMDRAARSLAWDEAQYTKSVKRIEREIDEAQRDREKSHRWFRIKSEFSEDTKNSKRALSSTVSPRATNIQNITGALLKYGFAVTDKKGRLFVFMRVRYVSCGRTKQGAARALVHYGIDGAHLLADGSLAFHSNMGETRHEAGEAFDQIELINRNTAKNAKNVFHAIMQSCHDLSPEKQLEMAISFCENTFGKQDLPYSVALHPPSSEGDQRNWHVHIVYSLRPVVRTDKYEWSVGRHLRTDLDSPEQFKNLRYLWAEEMNHACKNAGIPKRYTSLSYQASGIDFISQSHLGPALTAIVRRGEAVKLDIKNRHIALKNTTAHLAKFGRVQILNAVEQMRSDLEQALREKVLIASITHAKPIRIVPLFINGSAEKVIRPLRPSKAALEEKYNDASNDNVKARGAGSNKDSSSFKPVRADVPPFNNYAKTPQFSPIGLAKLAALSNIRRQKHSANMQTLPVFPSIKPLTKRRLGRSISHMQTMRLPSINLRPLHREYTAHAKAHSAMIVVSKINLGSLAPLNIVPQKTMANFAGTNIYDENIKPLARRTDSASDRAKTASWKNFSALKFVIRPLTVRDTEAKSANILPSFDTTSVSSLKSSLFRKNWKRYLVEAISRPASSMAGADPDSTGFSAPKQLQPSHLQISKKENTIANSIGSNLESQPTAANLEFLISKLGNTYLSLSMDDQNLVYFPVVLIDTYDLSDQDIASEPSQRKLLPIFAEQQHNLDKLEQELVYLQAKNKDEEASSFLSILFEQTNNDEQKKRKDDLRYKLSVRARSIFDTYSRTSALAEMSLRLSMRQDGQKLTPRISDLMARGFDVPKLLDSFAEQQDDMTRRSSSHSIISLRDNRGIEL